MSNNENNENIKRFLEAYNKKSFRQLSWKFNSNKTNIRNMCLKINNITEKYKYTTDASIYNYKCIMDVWSYNKDTLPCNFTLIYSKGRDSAYHLKIYGFAQRDKIYLQNNRPFELCNFIHDVLMIVNPNYRDAYIADNAHRRRKYLVTAYNVMGMHGRNTAKLRFNPELNQPAGAGANNYRSRENKITRILRRVGWNNTDETRERVHNLLERGYFGNIGNNNNGNNNVNTGGVYESKDNS
jgi:hypothetical protein